MDAAVFIIGVVTAWTVEFNDIHLEVGGGVGIGLHDMQATASAVGRVAAKHAASHGDLEDGASCGGRDDGHSTTGAARCI